MKTSTSKDSKPSSSSSLKQNTLDPNPQSDIILVLGRRVKELYFAKVYYIQSGFCLGSVSFLLATESNTAGQRFTIVFLAQKQSKDSRTDSL